MDYMEIVKVFHISLLYFPVGKGAIHHGQTVIREMETKEKLTVNITDPKTKEIICDATDIFPEYFFISVPLFNDRLEKEMDDWLYVLKYDDVPETYHSPYMQRVADKLSILKMTPDERNSYYAYMKQMYSDRDELQAAEAKGRKEGREETTQQVAEELIKEGVPLEKISRVTKLSMEIVQALAAEVAVNGGEEA